MTQSTASRHAYLLTAHEKPEQLATLLGLLDDAQNDLYIHIDQKARGFSTEALCAAAPRSRVFFVPRLDARWGHETFVDVIVSLLHAATRTEHLYYHLLSGADLPLKSQRDIHAFFAAHAGKEFVAFDAETPDAAMLRQRLGRYHLRQPVRPLARRFFRRLASAYLGLQDLMRIDRLKNCPVAFQKGAVWFSITHALAVYAQEQAPRYRSYYRKSVCADEIWLQTILSHSPFMQNRAFMGWGDELLATMRYVDWSEGGRSPRVLTSADYTALRSSGMLFARKFDSAQDAGIIARIVSDIRAGG